MTTTTPTATTTFTRRAARAWLIWVAGYLAFPVAGLVAGVAVTDHFTTFGASGAITVTTLLGVLLHLVLPPTTHLTGDPS